MEEIARLLILVHHAQMALLLMNRKLTVKLYEEMERSMPLKLEMMKIKIMAMAVTLLER